MKTRVREKEIAIRLRKEGYPYSDILRVVAVAKSTLSEWLKDLPLTESEKHYLKNRRDKNISRGRIKAATAHQQNKIERNRKIFLQSKLEFTDLVKNPLFQIGLALYWAEGSKRNWGFQFTNSDTDMILLMTKWMHKFLGVSKERIRPSLYLHKPYANENCEQYWASKIGIPLSQFRKTVYKKGTGLGSKKRLNYKGCLRIDVNGGGASYMLQKTKAWQQCLIDYYQKQA